MAVKVNNTENIRKSKRWNEKDDAALTLLLKKKLREMDVSIRESNTPYERSRLKETKQQYKQMLRKVETGVYNGDIIFAEMQAAAALRGEQQGKMEYYGQSQNGRAYVNSYQDMDFDYEAAFRKTRYYGAALPFIMLIFVSLLLCIFVMGAFLPAKLKETADSYSLNLNAMFVYKLSDSFDIEITNDGTWPSGSYAANAAIPVEGVPFADLQGNVPAMVKLYKDMKMTTIDISAFDIIKAWFRTPMLEKVRLDFLEDRAAFKGSSYYYLCFLSGSKTDDLKIIKDAEGNYDFSVILRHIGTYGTILFMVISFLLGVIVFISTLIRLFTYTTRKLHVLHWLLLIFSALAFISPALASIEGTEIVASVQNYFLSLTSINTFLSTEGTTAGIGLLYLIPTACSLLLLILPKIFRNRLKRRVTSVPRGNKMRLAQNDPYLMNEEVLKHLV
jgi:hypothetical protein